VEAATKLIVEFNGQKKSFGFRFANLSVAVSRTEYLILKGCSKSMETL